MEKLINDEEEKTDQNGHTVYLHLFQSVRLSVCLSSYYVLYDIDFVFSCVLQPLQMISNKMSHIDSKEVKQKV